MTTVSHKCSTMYVYIAREYWMYSLNIRQTGTPVSNHTLLKKNIPVTKAGV